MKKAIIILVNGILPYVAIFATHYAYITVCLSFGFLISALFFTGLNEKKDTKVLGDIAALTYLIGLFIAVTVQLLK